MTTVTKPIVALIGAVTTGAAFLVTSGLLHGTALTLTQAGIAALDAALTTLGVKVAPNGTHDSTVTAPADKAAS